MKYKNKDGISLNYTQKDKWLICNRNVGRFRFIAVCQHLTHDFLKFFFVALWLFSDLSSIFFGWLVCCESIPCT